MHNYEELKNEFVGVLQTIHSILDQPVHYTSIINDVEDCHKKIRLLREDCLIVKNLINLCIDRNVSFDEEVTQ